MNSMTTGGPRPITGASITAWGVPIDEWRFIAQQAQADVQTNPSDEEAQRQLRMAQRALRTFNEQVLGPMVNRANERDQRNLTTESAALRTGPAQAYGAKFAHGASFGLGDDIAGIMTQGPAAARRVIHGTTLGLGDDIAARALPDDPTTSQQARDRYRAGLDQLDADQPIAAPAGEISGAIGLGVATVPALTATGAGLAGVGATRAVGPLQQMLGTVLANFGRTIGAGGTLGGRHLPSMAAGGALAGAEGFIRGMAGEGSAGERLEDAMSRAPKDALVGAGLTRVVNHFRLRGARQRQADENLLNEGRIKRAQADQAEGTVEPRIVTAENNAALSTERVGAMPGVRSRQVAANRRAEGAAVRAAQANRRAAAREADRAADRPTQEGILRERGEQAPMQTELLRRRVERANRMRPTNPAAPASETEAGIRARLAKQGYDEANIERIVAQRNAARMPGAASQAPPSEITPASAPTQGGVVPTRGEAVVPVSETPAMMRGKRGQFNQADMTVNAPNPETQTFFTLVGTPLTDDVATQVQNAVRAGTPEQIEAFRREFMNSRNYGLISREWVDFLDELFGGS